ncbi:MAG: NAD(P)/FAD-dependent oxidoreductase [Thermoleophilia bacterium]|nr:NAD(P)/FAD-dependent oxidoreductase [Thermoleophilia bacterium]
MSGSIDSSHSSTDRSVAIIGAGIAGLCTGIYAQMNGYAAHIYEMHTKPGGLCTAWKRNGYTIDGCIHWFTGSRPGSSLYKLWSEIGLIQSLELIDLDEFMRVEFPDAPTIVFYADLDRLRRHLTDVFPEDAEFVSEFLDDAKRLARYELPSDLPPRELMGVLTTLRIMPRMLRILGPLRKWNALTVAQFAERIKNPHLRVAFSQLWLPEMSAFALLMTLSWFHARQAGYPLGGSMPISEALERRFVQLGGQIDYRTRVTDIMIENDHATGVRLTGGREEPADLVVSAADGHATIYDMLKGRYVDDTVRGWFEDLVPFPPLVFVGLGVGRTFSEEPRITNGASMGLARPLKVGEHTVDRLSYHLHNFDPMLAPEGKTSITCMFVADYEYWRDLSQDRERYEAEKTSIADAVIEALDGRFPGLAGLVEMVDVATPATFERYTGNWRGSFEGWLPTPAAMTDSMRRTLPGLDGFYMAGQWVAPGGGLPSGVMTGREVVQLMCHRDGKKFRVPAQ